MAGGQPNYYIYRGVRYLDCPKGVKIVKYMKDAENGGCYAVVRRTHKWLQVCYLAALCVLCVLCSIWVLHGAGSKQGVEAYILYSPTQAISFDKSYIYIGLQADVKNPAGVWLSFLREDGVYIMEGVLLNPGEALGVVKLDLPLRPGAANYVLEVWDKDKLKMLGQKVITLVYMGE